MILKGKLIIKLIISSMLIAWLANHWPQFNVPEVVTNYPTETDSVLNNPYMGWVPWASGGPYPQPHKLVYINATWASLEPQKGFYDFKNFEEKYRFNYWPQKDVKYIIRINMDYPGSRAHIDIPQWLYNEINGDGTWYDVPYGKGFSPNYSNSKLITYHEHLIKALGERYNRNESIAFVAIGSLGHWGEFHTWQSAPKKITFPKTEVTDRYIHHYLSAFPNKYLLMRRPFSIAKEKGLGLFNDSFGDPTQTNSYFIDFINRGYRDYLTGEYHPAMGDFWKDAPSGGEFADYPGLKYLEDTTITQTLQQVTESHTSWLGPSAPVYLIKNSKLQANFDRLLKTMGYRFVIKSVSHLYTIVQGAQLRIAFVVENRGVAPFYFNWPFEISLSDSTGKIVAQAHSSENIRTWLPGTKEFTAGITVPDHLPSGVYEVNVSILDRSTRKPGIDFAMSGRRADGRYTVSRVKIQDSQNTLWSILK